MYIGRHVNSNVRYAHSLKAISNSSTILGIQSTFDRVCARMFIGKIHQRDKLAQIDKLALVSGQ